MQPNVIIRWRESNADVMLDFVARRQEFILDCDDYPEAVGWLRELLATALLWGGLSHGR